MGAATVGLLLGGVGVVRAQGGLPWEVAPGAEMVETSDFGPMPSEIIWRRDGMPMVLVPAGTFEMGLDQSAGGREDESPVRTIELPSFYIDKFEVSNKQYNGFADRRGAPRPALAMGATGLADEMPVVAIPWQAAADYADSMGKQLPTEAMWEKAARGPAGLLFTTGATPDFEKVVVGRGAAGEPVPVQENTGDVSPFGVLHMTGNVREWLADWYGARYYESMPEREPRGPADADARSVRGGSYYDKADVISVRTTTRFQLVPEQTREEVGFRTAFILRPPGTPTPSPTPRPTPVPQEDPMTRVKARIETLERLYATGATTVPRQFVIEPRLTEIAQVANYSPFPLRLAFVSERGTISGFGITAPPCSFTNVPVPFYDDTTRVFLTTSVDDPSTSSTVMNAGEISAAKNLITIIPPSVKVEVLNVRGEKVDVSPELRHFYSDFRPQWDEVDVFSRVDIPIEISVTPIDDNKKPSGDPLTFIVPPKAFVSFKPAPGLYAVTTNYLGASVKSTKSWEVNVTSTAARRLLTISPDLAQPADQVVFARRLNPLTITVNEAVLRSVVDSPNK